MVSYPLGQGCAEDRRLDGVHPCAVGGGRQAVGVQVEGHRTAYVGSRHGGAVVPGKAAVLVGGEDAPAGRSYVRPKVAEVVKAVVLLANHTTPIH